MRNFYKGTSVSEYALIGGLVVIVGIGTLSVLGQNVSSLFSNTIASKKTAQVPATIALNNPSVPSIPASPFSAGTGVSDIAINVTNKNGQLVNVSIPNYPFDKTALAKDIEVNGSDATTKKLALTLERIGNILLANDVIDTADADLLKSMSQEGFGIAGIQKNMSDALVAAKATGIFLNPPSNAERVKEPLANLEQLYNDLKKKPFMQQANIAALVDDAVTTLKKTGTETLKYNTNMIYNSDSAIDRTVAFQQLFDFTGGRDLNQSLTNVFKKSTGSSSNLCNMSATGEVSGLNCVNRTAAP